MGRLNRIYILPTGFGLVFISGAMLMILVGASYQNNLVNMLAFFMMSLIFIAMVQTHNNLKDIGLSQLTADGGFSGDEYLVTVVLANKSDEPRFNLETKIRRKKPKSVYENVHPLLSKSQLKLRASYASGKRGRYKLSDVHVSAVFPLGLFRAWVILPGETHVYVYPKPEGSLSVRPSTTTNEQSGSQIVRGGEDFYGHRRYQVGDSPGHIDWRARAKKRPLLVKEFDQGSPAPVLLDWDQLSDLDNEARLSQLALWVNDCTAQRSLFGLKLPGVYVPPSLGAAHSQKCLECLSVHGLGGQPHGP